MNGNDPGTGNDGQRRVAEFFDRHADSYHAAPLKPAPGMGPFHDVSSRWIEAGLTGEVLAVGGLWWKPELAPSRFRVTVSDISAGMLRHQLPAGARGVLSDVLTPAFAPASFDHAVVPLVLHHLTDRGAADARARVRRALVALATVVRPGGRLWISDFDVSAWIYGLELAAAPLTRLALAAVGEPLVIMHHAGFYRRALAAAGWSDIEVRRVTTPAARPGDWVRPLIALPWLRMPRFLYPLRPVLITARR